jgi:hypothetical protein
MTSTTLRQYRRGPWSRLLARSFVESPDARAGDNFKSLVPQEVGGQVVLFDVGLLKPGDSQVEAALGHPRRLRV